MRAVDRTPIGKMLRLAAWALAATLVFAATGPASAVSADCDVLASSPSDPGRIGSGVAIEKIDSQAAIAACAAAFAERPDDPWLAFEFGRAREAAGQFDDAARLYAVAADHGHLVAPLNLGLLYLQGRGVAKNVDEGVRWMSKAAEHGLIAAQLDLGMLYRDGAEGVVKDEREAARYFKLAADEGDPRAKIQLAHLDRDDRGGLPKDDGESARLVKAPADQIEDKTQTALFAFRDSEIVTP